MHENKFRRNRPSLNDLASELAEGHYVVEPSGAKYKIRALAKYCKEKGIKPSVLSESELKKFQV